MTSLALRSAHARASVKNWHELGRGGNRLPISSANPLKEMIELTLVGGEDLGAKLGAMLILERNDLNVLEFVKLIGNVVVVDGQDALVPPMFVASK